MQLKGHNGMITYRDGSLHIENTKLQSQHMQKPALYLKNAKKKQYRRFEKTYIVHTLQKFSDGACSD
jgi:hypothetical protein